MALGSEIAIWRLYIPKAALRATSCDQITVPAIRARLKNARGLEARLSPALNLPRTEMVLRAKFGVGGTNGVAVH